MPRVIGIDLGTTNSAMAQYDDGEAEIITNAEGDATTPSVVQFKNGEHIVGKAAKNTRVSYADRTILHVKRHMGDEWETQEIDGETYRPEAISAFILKKLKKDAEDRLGESVSGAVITVPAYFGIKQREATKNAAEIADLEAERIINEPTAACLQYTTELDEELLHGEKETVFVYDLGGGTFDATLVEVGDGVVRVIGTGGDKQLGGEDFDNEVYEYIKQQYQEAGHGEVGKTLESNLREEAQKLKEQLTSMKEASLEQMLSPEETFQVTMTRDEFEQEVDHLVEKTIRTVDDLFNHPNVDATMDDVDRVLLVGGSTRIPLVQKRVEEKFGMEPSKELEPDYVVAEGAAIQAGNLETVYEVDPDGDGGGDGDNGHTETELVDVLAHTVGVEVYVEDGPNELSPILEQNQEVGKGDTGEFTTVEDNQTEIEICVFEGEDPIAEKNEEIGNFKLSGIKPQAAGEPTIEVSFRVTEEGVLEATAVDKETGKEATAEFTVGLDDITPIKEKVSNVPARR